MLTQQKLQTSREMENTADCPLTAGHGEQKNADGMYHHPRFYSMLAFLPQAEGAAKQHALSAA